MLVEACVSDDQGDFQLSVCEGRDLSPTCGIHKCWLFIRACAELLVAIIALCKFWAHHCPVLIVADIPVESPFSVPDCLQPRRLMDRVYGLFSRGRPSSAAIKRRYLRTQVGLSA